MATFALLKCLFILIVLKLEVESIEEVFLLPSLCGTTAARTSTKIIKAHSGMERGNDVYSDVIPSCVYVVQAESTSHKLLFSVGAGVGEVRGVFHDMGCSGAKLRLIDSDGSTQLAELCGIINRTHYHSSGDRLTLELLLPEGGNSSVVNFTAAYTSYIDTANCSTDTTLFPCSNGKCISREGQCDATLINNCGDFSDNSPGPPGNCSEEETTVVSTVPSTTAPGTSSDSDQTINQTIILVAGIVAGLGGCYLFYWLLWRPGYLVWRCSFWRHLSGSQNSSYGTSPKKSAFTNVNGAHNGNVKPNLNQNYNFPLETNSSGVVAGTTTRGHLPVENIQAKHPAISGIQREKHIFSTTPSNKEYNDYGTYNLIGSAAASSW